MKLSLNHNIKHYLRKTEYDPLFWHKNFREVENMNLDLDNIADFTLYINIKIGKNTC